MSQCMKHRVLAGGVGVSLILSSVIGGIAWGFSIYGEDDRVELANVRNDLVQDLARSSMALFEKKDLELDAATGRYQNKNLETLAKRGLCESERFSEQFSSAYCSGALIGPDLVLTAGHCIRAIPCEDTRFVFDFVADAASPQGSTSFAQDQVYSCKKVVKIQENNNGAGGFILLGGLDYAIVKLDRKVEGRKPVVLEKDGKLKEGDNLVLIGHPIGLPMKVTPGQFGFYAPEVRFFRGKTVLNANLDAFGGNSGSSVYNAESGKVEGVLVRGPVDFVDTVNDEGETCKVSVKNPDSYSIELVRSDVIYKENEDLLDRAQRPRR